VKEMLDGMEGWRKEGYPVEETVIQMPFPRLSRSLLPSIVVDCLRSSEHNTEKQPDSIPNLGAVV